MSLNRQLSELSASELNDAIDDTNFPQSHVLSRGRNNSVCSTSSAPATVLGAERRTLSYSDDGNAQLAAQLSAASSESGLTGILDDAPGAELAQSLNSIPSTAALRPHLSLKLNGIIGSSETEPSSNGSTTPTTPRTSKTPGWPCESRARFQDSPFLSLIANSNFPCLLTEQKLGRQMG